MPHNPLLQDKILNVEDVASILHLSRNTIYKMVREGTLASYRVGRKLMFTMQDVESYLQNGRSGGDALANVPSDKKGEIEGGNVQESSAFPGDIHFVHLPGRRAADRDTLVLAGDDLVGDIIANHAMQSGIAVQRQHESSYCGLVDLYSGAIDATLIHLYDTRTNSYNIPFVQRLAPGLSITVIRLLKRKIGFVVKRDNPKGINAWRSLAREDVRVASRQKGFATRVLLDERLIVMDYSANDIDQTLVVLDSEAELVTAVERGLADVAIVNEDSYGQEDAITFIPVQEEFLDLAIVKDKTTRSFRRMCIEMMSNMGFTKQVQALTKGSTEQLGAIIYDC